MAGQKRLPPVIWLAKHTWGVYAKKHFNLSLSGKEKLKIFEGPAIIMANHTNFFDPFFISVLYPFHIRWVAGAYLFKFKVLGFIVDKLARCISKQQGRSDFTTIRNIQRALRNGNRVGLFPEGSRNWDGNYVPLEGLTTAKMIKVFKVPVMFVQVQSGFAQKPRWADYTRKGPLKIELQSIMNPAEIKEYSVDDLAKEINKRLEFNSHDWQVKNNINYICKKNAEGIQRMLYLCPKCGGVQTISAEGNQIKCTCGAHGILDEKDGIVSDDFGFSDLPEWHRWEKQKIAEVSCFPPERGILFQIGEENKLKTISKDIEISADQKSLTVFCKDTGEKKILNWDDVSSLILNAKQTIELFCDGKLYRIRVKEDSSALKYRELFLGLRS